MQDEQKLEHGVAICWLLDEATIKGIPLLNKLVMCGNKPQVVVFVSDCTGQMVKCGKKDLDFIMIFLR